MMQTKVGEQKTTYVQLNEPIAGKRGPNKTFADLLTYVSKVNPH